MAKILLDYFFKIISINPTPAASTAYLKQACLVVKPKGGYGGAIGTPVLCTTNAQIAAITDNVEGQQFLNAGLSRVYIMPVNDLYLDEFLAAAPAINKFFTLVISSDFSDADITPSQAQGVFTVSSYANLVSGTDDVVTIAGVALTAQTGASTPGDSTFQAATDNAATAASLAAQINAHPTLAPIVVASVVGAVVTVKAVSTGSLGNNITATYTDNDTNVGGAWTGLTGGKLAGGDGLSVGPFKGVIGGASTDSAFAASMAAKENYSWFKTSNTNKTKNAAFAFGKLLSIPGDWKNQQYVTMPFDDGVNILGDADSLFDDKVSFVISDEEFGTRLALFAVGGKAIVAPYIIRNLEIDLQSKGLQYVSANQPAYTLTQAALMEDELQKVIDGDGLENGNPGYVGKGWITSGKVDVTLPNDNFVAAASISVPTPRAMWRINGIITQS